MAHTVRTAYKVWSGIAAGVFCLVAIIDVSSNHTAPATAPVASSAASPAPASAPTSGAAPAAARDPMDGSVFDMSAGVAKSVRKLDSYRDIEFTDGTVAHVDAADLTTEPWAGCQERVLTAAAHRLLDGRTVTVGRDSSHTYSDRRDWVRLRGYEQYSAETDYTIALTSETTTKVMDQCYPETSATEAPSSSSPDVDVDVDHDHDLPDGALTGGYCRHKWWC